jgi:hypothetical protein
MNVLESCKPRFEVLKGDLDDAIFAADFGDLVAKKAPTVYSDAKTFFQNTHPAQPLCKVVRAVFERLKDSSEGGITVRLSTGFGGGKTHTLMAMWHLAQNVADAALGAELLPPSSRPPNVTAVAVDLGKAGLPIFSQRGKTKIRSLWGDIFAQLDPVNGLKVLGEADDPEASPNASQIEEVMPDGPILFLLDEIVIYMAKLSDRGQGNLLGFLNLLAGVVRNRPQSCLVVTDPGAQAVYAGQSAKLAAQFTTDAAKLEEIFGRKMSDLDPIGDESAKVIVRRLFESVDGKAAQATAKIYSELYRRVSEADPKSIPASAATSSYEKKIAETYPFHPRLLDTAKDRLAALDNFQQSRGVLRLFARILRDVWDQTIDCQIVTAGEIDWSSSRIQADLLQRLNRDRFKPAVSADIEEHAMELDGGVKRGLHGRAASALLLESLPMNANSGLDEAELTLAILRPEEAGTEPAEAMDRLAGVCWHTYPMPGGRGLQFRFDQNILKQIDERRSKVSRDDAISRVQAEVQNYFQGPMFKQRPWPTNASQAPDSADLQLVLCVDEKLAQSVVANQDDRDTSSIVPRSFRNAIAAVAANAGKWEGAVERAQRLMAAEQIERENKSSQASSEVREQIARLMPDLKKQFLVQSYRAFDRVVLADSTVASLEEQYLANEENVLQKPNGQQNLAKFLADKKLIYKSEDALDPTKFVSILPGATPIPGDSQVFTASAAHERMLAASGLRIIPGPDVVRNTLLKSVAAGKIVVRIADGAAYDSRGCVTGATGERRREKGELSTLALDDSTLVTLATTARASEWTTEDTPKTGETPPGGGTSGGKKAPPPPPPSQVSAQSWPKIIEYSTTRPLIELKLTAPAPALAATLATLTQPLGADFLLLTVTVSGALKDGGTMQFSADSVKLNHPAKPLTIAQTIFNSASDGVSYEAQLVAAFSALGRDGLTESLKLLAEQSAAEIQPAALFGKPTNTP